MKATASLKNYMNYELESGIKTFYDFNLFSYLSFGNKLF